MKLSGFSSAIVRTHNKWSEKDALTYLRSTLEGGAANVLCDHGDKVTKSLFKLTDTLKQKFGGQAFADKHRIELKNRRRRKDKTVQSHHADIRRLAALVFPTANYETCEAMATDVFLMP